VRSNYRLKPTGRLTVWKKTTKIVLLPDRSAGNRNLDHRGRAEVWRSMGGEFTAPEESRIQSIAVPYSIQNGDRVWKNGCNGNVDRMAGFE